MSNIRCPECGWFAKYVGQNEKVGVVEYKCESPATHEWGHVFFIEVEKGKGKRRVRCP